MNNRTWRKAHVLSLNHLRQRARDHWTLGQTVNACVEACDFCNGSGVDRGARCLSCDGEGKNTVVESGPFGVPSIVPSTMVEFIEP